jgi:hypothetical protein
MPPEALRAVAEDEDEDEATGEKPSKAWDVYSYGCVVFQVCQIVDARNQTYSSSRSSRENSPTRG